MLNTKVEDRIDTNISAENAISICRKAIAEIGWRVLNQSENRIRCKEVAVSGVSFNWPAEVEIIISSSSPSSATIFLNGSIFGFGPIQKGHLQGQIGNLRNRIEIAVQEALKHPSAEASINSPGSLAEELTKLSSLHKEGILTDEEFRKAKERLIKGKES